MTIYTSGAKCKRAAKYKSKHPNWVQRGCFWSRRAKKIPTSYLTFILNEKKIVNVVSSFSSSFEKKRKHYEGSCSVFFLNNRSKCCYFTLCCVSAFNSGERSLFQLFTSFFTWKSIKREKRITANTLSIHLIPVEQQEQFQCYFFWYSNVFSCTVFWNPSLWFLFFAPSAFDVK